MSLLARIADRSAVVCVMGMGYVGLPLARAMVDAGLRVIGFDTDAAKVSTLNSGGTYLRHLGDDFVAGMVRSGRFSATGDEARLSEADAILICVPTPLDAKNEPDLSYVESTADAIARGLRPGQLIVLESTTYPGTTREVLLPRFAARGLVCGGDAGFYLAFSPEREDPGRKDHSVRTIPKLVGGVDAASTRVAAALYRLAVVEVIEVSSAEVAESAKLVENIYRAVNIAMVNELKVILGAMNIDVWEVIDAARTKPFGFQAFYPGPGLGGHCIPIDPFYLSWRARQIAARGAAGGGASGANPSAASADLEARFIELAGRVNHAMPAYVVKRTLDALGQDGAKAAVPGSARRVLVLGLAYKPDIDDVRESPSFELMEGFRAAGLHVDYHDPHVARTHAMRRHGDLGMQSVEWSERSLSSYDAVVIATHHSWYDWAFVGRHARLVIDTRGVMRRGTHAARIVTA